MSEAASFDHLRMPDTATLTRCCINPTVTRAIEISEALLTEPLSSVNQVQVVDGLPSAPGIYAWWTKVDVGDLRKEFAPTEHLDGFRLLYLGIAPRGSSGRTTLRSRIVGQHIRGNTATSTLRFGLAALLGPSMGWVPLAKNGKIYLSQQDNTSLSHWQRDQLGLNWVAEPQPWKVEEEVIELMHPPMNRAHNRAHPFYGRMGLAREDFRRNARVLPQGN